MGLPPLSGKDLSLARAFLGTPLRGRSPLGRPSSGRSGMLSGRSGRGCVHQVIYQGGHAVLEGLFHGLSSEHVAGHVHTSPQHRAFEQRDGRTEQSFEDTPEAMSSLVPSPGEWRDGRGHHDDDVRADVLVSSPAFKWHLLALTVRYNHLDELELRPAHGQPIQSPRLVAHDLTMATCGGHCTQQAIPDIAYHVSDDGKVAVHKEALHQVSPGLRGSHVACVALANQHSLLVRPA